MIAVSQMGASVSVYSISLFLHIVGALGQPSTAGALGAMVMAVVLGLAAAIPARSSARRPARVAGSER